jgi:dipeptidyl aminopeptidase/acylaminoacyl peptidase
MVRLNASSGACILAASLLALAASAARANPPQPLAPADVFDLEYAADPQVSPDGRQVAYERHFFDIKSDRGRTAIWVVSADGTGHRPLAAGSFTESMPRWSPDGRRLAYVAADRDGSAQLFVRYLDEGVFARVTNVLESPTEMAWSPDGRSLAFVMNVAEEGEPLDVKLPRAPKGAEWAEPLKVVDRVVYRADGRGPLPDAHAQLFVVPADGGTPRQLTQGPYDHRALAWSADGSEIIVSANRREDRDSHPLDSELHAVEVVDGAIRALTDRYGPDRAAAVSPDGRRLAWVGFDDRLLGYQRSRLYVMDREEGTPRELAASLDRDLDAPRWWPDGRSLVVESDDHGRTRLLRIFLDGRVEVLADDLGGTSWSRPYPGGSFSIGGDGRIAYTAVTPWRPAEVASLDRKGGRTVLTDLNRDLLGFRQLGEVEEMVARSSADGREVQGWIVKPPGFDPSRKYPLVLEIHGGPFANYGPRFAAEMQLYAAAGYVVLYTNPRGSTSYGEEFGNLIHHAYPGQDYDDLMSAVDAVIARGYVDPGRLYVTGGSGGGVLTAWIVGNTDRFKAAVVQKPVINWTSFSLTADATNFFSRYWFPAPPWEQPEEYWRRSPLSLVGKVTTPTMLVTGEQDLRTPIAESEQFYAALKLRGVDTLLVRVPGAPHSLDLRPSQLIARNRYILAWFARYGGAELSAPARPVD